MGGMQPRWLLLALFVAVIVGIAIAVCSSAPWPAADGLIRHTGAMPTKCILDVDTGTDDAVALMTAALSPDLELVGATIGQRQHDARLHAPRTRSGSSTGSGMPEMPVYRGMDRPLARSQVAQRPGDPDPRRPARPAAVATVATPGRSTRSTGSSTPTSRRTATSRSVPVGPLTNIAMAIQKEPRIVERIPEIVIMGGAHDHGNATASAEFNIWLDPEAARIVVNCGRPIRMVPLDATHRALVSTEDAGRLRALGTPAGEAAARFVAEAHRGLRRDPADAPRRAPRPSTTRWRSARSSTRRSSRPELIQVDVETDARAIGRADGVRLPLPQPASPRTSTSRWTPTSRSSSACSWRSSAAPPDRSVETLPAVLGFA